jgi:TPR repeat protein
MRRWLAAALMAVSLMGGALLGPPAAAEEAPDIRYAVAVLAYDRGKYDEALSTFRELADTGTPEAEFMLGAMYFYGKGVVRDDVLAAIWFHKAANKGNANAQFALGSMLIGGLGVRQDLVEAYTWLTLASNDGLPALRQQAILLREQAARLMRPDEVAKATREAADWSPSRSGLTWGD